MYEWVDNTSRFMSVSKIPYIRYMFVAVALNECVDATSR